MEIGKIVGRGRTADVFEYGHDSIIKILKPRFSNSLAEKEEKLHTIVQDSGLPVPKLLDVVMIDGKKGLVYQKINGISMLDSIRDNPNKMPDYANDLASLHIDISRCKIDDDRLETVNKRYLSWIENTDILTAEDKEKVLSYLGELPHGNSLCHSDFHADNILIDNGKYYIIDWLTAAKGSFCADVMRSFMLIKYSSAADDLDITQEIRMGIDLFSKIYIDGVLKAGKLSLDDVFRWELPVLAARLWEGVPKSEEKVVLEQLHQLL